MENLNQAKKINISWFEFDKMCNNLANQVLKSNYKPDYIVGINRGGLPAAVVLSHLLEVPLYTLKVTLKDGVEEDCDHNCWMSEDAIGYGSAGCLEDKKTNILIVNDINNTGATYTWIQNDWRWAALPNFEEWNTVFGDNVRFAVLVDNATGKQAADYAAMQIDKTADPSWIVFPWEAE
jgi:hypoxanthine phosphoribosyltransferase